jgi:hypothetical protein
LSKRIDPLHPRVEVDIETIADWEFDRTYRYLGEAEPALRAGETPTRNDE